jgi:multisubunit Na+/H+ antiporter MnhB subunit
MGRIILWCCTVLLLLCVGALFLLSMGPRLSTQQEDIQPHLSGTAAYSLRDHLFLHGVEETGALNLVSAIYLGYRAFDTLGETIVLVLSVAAVVLITGGR